MPRDKILIVVAHPDDEILGMGGTIAKYAQKKDFYLLILTDGVSARDKKLIKKQEANAKKANRFLGVKDIYFLRFSDERLDAYPLLTIIQKIEKIIKTLQPTEVYTHFPYDVNQDHRRTYEAVAVACRPLSGSSIKRIFTFEIPGSTEWYYRDKFIPNYYEVLTKKEIDLKINAFKFYEKEVKKFPHPRSEEGIIIKAKIRGSEIGVPFAEGFYLIKAIVDYL
jgi:LmbE family N-acetylglucosaminyl deacetylase|uniref:PIG-L family deacetylase n=1 Tax=candidate division WOR-3 bacterium TaxID=2052148 RepID=A0A7V5XZE9_UNCW3